MDEIKHLTFNHVTPIGLMGGEEVMKEFLYPISGCADDIDPKKHVKLGLPPALQVRKKALEQHLVSSVNFHQIPAAPF